MKLIEIFELVEVSLFSLRTTRMSLASIHEIVAFVLSIHYLDLYCCLFWPARERERKISSTKQSTPRRRTNEHRSDKRQRRGCDHSKVTRFNRILGWEWIWFCICSVAWAMVIVNRLDESLFRSSPSSLTWTTRSSNILGVKARRRWWTCQWLAKRAKDNIHGSRSLSEESVSSIVDDTWLERCFVRERKGLGRAASRRWSIGLLFNETGLEVLETQRCRAWLCFITLTLEIGQ